MAESEEPKAEKKKSKKGMVLVLAVTIALAGGGAGTFALLKMKGGGAAAAHAEEAKTEPAPEPGVISLEPFVTNLADPEGDRYVKCTLRLELERRESADKLKTDEISITRLRDRVLTLLSSKKFAEVTTSEGKQRLREELRAELEPLLQGGKMREVYYTEFLVQ